MGRKMEGVDDGLARWIERQKVFFVATAPLSNTGRLNCSPKGYDTLRLVDPKTMIYLDYSGSGAETIAHIRENGRLLIMMCAFEGPPKICRFHGRGEVIPITDPQFPQLASLFEQALTGARSIIRLHIEHIAVACGYGVPEFAYKSDRPSLRDYAARRGDEGMARYRLKTNLESIDALPALSAGEAAALATKVVDND